MRIVQRTCRQSRWSCRYLQGGEGVCHDSVGGADVEASPRYRSAAIDSNQESRRLEPRRLCLAEEVE